MTNRFANCRICVNEAHGWGCTTAMNAPGGQEAQGLLDAVPRVVWDALKDGRRERRPLIRHRRVIPYAFMDLPRLVI